MQETRHNAEQVRYLYGTPNGILEFRALPTRTTIIETLIRHLPVCNGEQCADLGYQCDAGSADDVSLAWIASGDAGVWHELAAVAVAEDLADVDRTPVEPSHEQRAFRARLIAEGRQHTNPDHLNRDGEPDMTLDLRAKALDVVTAAAGGKPILPGNRLRLTKAVRASLKDAAGRAPMKLGPVVEAVDWAIERVNTTSLDRHRVPSDFGWVYRFPNGHEASVINDPSRPFRFEVLSDDPDDVARGRVSPALTSEQVEAKLHYIAALPNR